jgi:hypothetical protein
MGKVALGVAGLPTNPLRATVAEADTLRKHLTEPHKPNRLARDCSTRITFRSTRETCRIPARGTIEN